MAHTCHAAGCDTPVPPRMFMCKRHWYKLPRPMRDRVWATYRDGQCEDWNISTGYADAARAAVTWLGNHEQRTETEIRTACRVYDMLEPHGSDNERPEPDPDDGEAAAFRIGPRRPQNPRR